MTIPYGYFKILPGRSTMTNTLPSLSRAALAALLLATTALTACTTIPQSAPFAAENSASTKTNPIADVATEDSWWTSYGDPQLNDVIDKALNSSPDLAAAAGRLYKADAYTGSARASEYPTASFLGGDLALGNNAPISGVALAGLNFGYEFDFWGKNRAAITAAGNQAEAAQADQAQAKLVLTTAIAGAYIDLARLYDDRDLAERAVALKKENLDLVGNKKTQGLTSDAEVQLASSGYYNAQSDLSALDEQIGLTRNRIAALAGLDPDYGQTLTRPALKLPDAVTLPARIDLNLIGRRPDVVAARWRAEAASQQIKVAHASFYPNINLMAFVGQLMLGDPANMGSTMSSAGPAVTLPIFDGGRLNANLKGAEGEHAVAIASYNGAVVNAMHEAADAVTSEKALGQRLDDNIQALTASENAYNLVKSRYEGGLTDYATLLLAEQQVIAQRRAVADLQSRALTLNVALIKALGGSYDQATLASN